MWLDRISGNAGTPPNSRSYSPAPRRPATYLSATSQPNRPGIGSQPSSLSVLLTPTESTTSLPVGALHINELAFKNGFEKPHPVNVRDPLDVLNDILGRQKKEDVRDVSDAHPASAPASVEKPTVFVEEIDFGELSLEEFVRQEEEPRMLFQSDVGTHAIQQFEMERDKFQDLHTAIAGCDDVSKSVEMNLNDFQKELGAVSAEIQTLQNRSKQLNSMLENRRNVERLLGPAVEEISISPTAVRKISEGPIDENWVKALNEIETRSASIEAKISSLNGVKALEDMRPLLTDIRDKAVARIRDYLVTQIKALRSPNLNAQIIQQQRLVRFRDLYSFIARAHPTLAEEIVQAYINTMRWYYLSNFTRYQQALERIKLYHSDRNETLGGDSFSQKSGTIIPNNRAAAASHGPFSLGRRIDILRTSNHMALSSYLAEEDQSYHGIEVPFRNFNLALVDNVSAEYSFMTEMFSTMTYHQISRKALEVFDPVLALGQAFTKHLIENTHDCLGILICVRLNQQAAFELQRRKIPVADSYINGTNMQLWPRFQMIMDAHCESLKRVASNAGRGATSALSIAGGEDSKQSSAPHFLTQRFGQLLHGILTLSSEAGDDEPVSNSLARLSAEFDAVLTKLGRSSGDAKKREKFIFNNCSLILTIISDTQGKLATEQKQHFEELLTSIGKRS